MAYTKKNIKNLTGGVSQQPDELRFDNQCAAQTNFLSDPVRGLTKRAGTIYDQWISSTTAIGADAASEYLDAPTQNTFTHIINRSDGERLLLVVSYKSGTTGGKVELFKLNEDNLAYEELTVTGLISGGDDHVSHAYLLPHVAGVSQPLSAVTIADYTFIANNQVTPALLPTTSGGAGMYEREHVKRGIIFVKESAYDAEFTVKATDSEGTIRSIKIFTRSGSSAERDVSSDALAGAIHWALERTEDSDSLEFQRDINGGDAYTEHGAIALGIDARWSDDNSNHLWNGPGGTAALGGSNYSRGYIVFTEQPSAGDYINVDGGVPYYTFDFYANGGTYSGSNTGVEIGATINETAENFSVALNAITDVVFRAALTWVDGGNPTVSIVATSEGAMDTGIGEGGIAATGFSATVSSLTGGNSTAANSTAPVRYPITFERLPIERQDGSAQTAGSVISWYASYPTKAEADASPINIEVSDSYGDTMVETITEKTDRISSLPTTAPNNYLMKVEGDIENDADDHYVRFTHDSAVATNNQFGTGRWKESVESGIQYQLDSATMPHQLIKVDATTYKFQAATWSDKIVGDANSDSAPSFVGKPINDVFHHKSRLGFLAGESVILSEVDNAYNFWRTSVIDSLDSDRIDVSSSANEITYLNWAVPFANQLVVFSDNAQFLLTQGSQGLTPSTAALTLGSSYANSSVCRPVVNNNTIVFSQKKANSSELYEMYPTGSTDISFEAASICEHIPSYIEGEVVNISASSLASTIVAQTDADDNKLYVYNYFHSGGKKVQSAWSKYELACNHIKFGGFIADKFHLIEGHWSGDNTQTVDDCLWSLTHMNFDNTDSLTHAVDCAWNVPTGSMVHAGGVTTITAEWYISEHTNRVADKLVVFDSTTNITYPVTAYHASTGSRENKVLVTGNIASNANIVLGMKYTATYEFSKQYIKRGSADGKEVAITDGRTTNKWMEIYFNDTQHLTATVAFPSYAKRTTSTKTFNGNPDNTITGVRTGEQPSETESLRTSVAARNDLPIITLSSDTHQTVTVTGASFELMHTSRTSRTS